MADPRIVGSDSEHLGHRIAELEARVAAQDEILESLGSDAWAFIEEDVPAPHLHLSCDEAARSRPTWPLATSTTP